jgi:hypothetical protein
VNSGTCAAVHISQELLSFQYALPETGGNDAQFRLVNDFPFVTRAFSIDPLVGSRPFDPSPPVPDAFADM